MSNVENKVLTSFKAQAANGAETGVKKTDMFRVPPQDLFEEEGFNQRDYESPECVAQIEGFAKAYASGEYVPPLVVRIDPSNGRKFVVEGHQRKRGALLAISRGVDLPHLDCLPFRGNDVDRVVVQARSERGLKLTPLGLSKLYQMLHRKGLKNSEIATRMDVSVTTVESMLTLADASSDVQAMVKDGTVAASVAIDAVRKHGDKAADMLAAKLQDAKAKGKTSVKASAVKEWAPPRKVSLNLFSSITPVFKAVAEDEGLKELLARTDDIDPAELEGKTVTLSAASVLALCRNFQVADQLKNKRTGSTPESHPGDGEQADEA